MATKSIRFKVIQVFARDFPCNGEPTPSVLDSCPILRLRSRSRSLLHEDDATPSTRVRMTLQGYELVNMMIWYNINDFDEL